jgi:hypothetical protein
MPGSPEPLPFQSPAFGLSVNFGQYQRAFFAALFHLFVMPTTSNKQLSLQSRYADNKQQAPSNVMGDSNLAPMS